MVSVALAAAIGIVVGASAGYFGGSVDETLMRTSEAFLIIPIFLIILVAAKVFFALGPSTSMSKLLIITLLIGFFRWPDIAKVTRAEFLRLKESDFVEAARCLGASDISIIFRHIFPNMLPTIIVVSTLRIATAILMEASISFLGFGDPTSVSWGQMISIATHFMVQAPWAAIAPGLAIFVTVLGFNLTGEGLNDALNPRMREL
mgnify:CR=1 FL=1